MKKLGFIVFFILAAFSFASFSTPIKVPQTEKTCDQFVEYYRIADSLLITSKFITNNTKEPGSKKFAAYLSDVAFRMSVYAKRNFIAFRCASS